MFILQIFWMSLLPMALAQPSMAGCWQNDNSPAPEFFAFYSPWPDSMVMSHGDNRILTLSIKHEPFTLSERVEVVIIVVVDDLFRWRSRSNSSGRATE
jgi:hypothetical protein